MVRENHHSERVLATHSPILLAYPHPWIYQFPKTGIARINYEDTEHYQITRNFWSHRERRPEILPGAEDNDLKSKERK